jgi:hypothetical protein
MSRDYVAVLVHLLWYMCVNLVSGPVLLLEQILLFVLLFKIPSVSQCSCLWSHSPIIYRWERIYIAIGKAWTHITVSKAWTHTVSQQAMNWQGMNSYGHKQGMNSHSYQQGMDPCIIAVSKAWTHTVSQQAVNPYSYWQGMNSYRTSVKYSLSRFKLSTSDLTFRQTD